MKKSISIIGSKGLPAKYGGFETLTMHLSQELSSSFKVHVSCEKILKNDNDLFHLNGNINRFFIPFKANGPQSILYDIVSFIVAAKKSDTILILGIGLSIFLPLLKKMYPRKRIIVHTDGLEWERKKWSLITKKYLKHSFIKACTYSDALVTDNTLLFRFIKQHFNTIVKDIRYGIPDVKKSIKPANPDYYLTIARAEKENNLDLIADVFVSLPGLKWKVICNYKDTSYGRYFFKKFSKHKNIEIATANYDQDFIYNERANAIAYIHGHSVGGSNPSLIEILPYDRPIVCYDTIFNRETTFNAANYFKNRTGLIKILKDKSYKQNSKLKKLALEKYDWKKVAEEYKLLFESL